MPQTSSSSTLYAVGWKLLVGTLITGILVELLNANLYAIWVYSWPWNTVMISPINVSLTVLTLGWFLLWLGSLLCSFGYLALFRNHSVQRAWVWGWVVIAFLFELINVYLFRAWQYPAANLWWGTRMTTNPFGTFVIPGLEFSILVPLGYAACGVIAYWITSTLFPRTIN